MAERLNLVTFVGSADGFPTMLPAGTVLARAVLAGNRNHLRELGAVGIDFPAIFDSAPDDMRSLVASYEANHRMFRLDEAGHDLRLSYAADPGLFSWLRGSRIERQALPYTIVSDVEVMRRFRKGELGSLAKVRQYHLPDIHSLVSLENAAEFLIHATRLAAEQLSWWAGESWVQFIDITKALLEREPALPKLLATVAGRPTMVNVLADQPLYYGMRTGLMPDAGTGVLLLYNFQWDEDNPRRFCIDLDDNSQLLVLHANVAAASGILCLALGRALAGLAPPVLPIEIAPEQIVILALTDFHLSAARGHANRLRRLGLRIAVELADKGLSNAIAGLKSRWQPWFAVVGDNEAQASSLMFQPTWERTALSEAEFMARFGERIARCRIDDYLAIRPPPFVVGAGS
ncbi:hypothetical protein [Rhodospirillum sp. A1_3_36]|uniref:hypothetical protein n=1 Tax=Rhodospirillum sp. A1_3_36 TaxID=3391666 RepID=UPI0039A6AADA